MMSRVWYLLELGEDIEQEPERIPQPVQLSEAFKALLVWEPTSPGDMLSVSPSPRASSVAKSSHPGALHQLGHSVLNLVSCPRGLWLSEMEFCPSAPMVIRETGRRQHGHPLMPGFHQETWAWKWNLDSCYFVGIMIQNIFFQIKFSKCHILTLWQGETMIWAVQVCPHTQPKMSCEEASHKPALQAPSTWSCLWGPHSCAAPLRWHLFAICWLWTWSECVPTPLH